MITGKQTFILILSGLGIGFGSYFLLRKSNTQLKREILQNVPDRDKVQFASILDQMTRQELMDTAEIMQYAPENTPKSITDKIDPLLKVRLAAISKKYNIFT
jgi:hypothetical protein